MAKAGNITLTNDSALELNPSDRALSAGEIAIVPGEFHVHNSGPDEILITLHSSDLGLDEGYPLGEGERETFRHTGSLFIRCETASGGNPVVIDYIITSGC